MSKNYIVFDSMMVPPQKNIFLLLYCIIFDNKFLLILRNSKLLSINFLCVTLSHMSIAAGVILSITLQQVDAAPDTQGTAQTDHDRLQSIDCAVEKFHKVLTFCRLFCGTQKFFQKMPPHSAAASSSDRSISYRSKLSSCATTCCRFRRRVDKNLSTSKVFFLSASARYL